jgi:hypothetical protein
MRLWQRFTVFFAKYFVFPLVMSFSGWLLFLAVLGLISGIRPSFESSLYSSLIIALFLSIAIFGMESAVWLGNFLGQSLRLDEFEQTHFSWIRKASLESRLELQTYLRWSALAAALLFISFFIVSVENTGASPTPYTDWALGFFGVMAVLMIARQSAVREREKTAHYLERFYDELRDYIAKVGPKPDFENLEMALNSYQSLFPYCRIPNIGKRLAQIRLALDRGTKKEIKELERAFRILSISMADRNPSLFDTQFNFLIELLDKVEAEKKDIGEIVASRRDRFNSLLSEMKQPMLHRVLPTVLIIMAVYLGYALTGNRINIP